MKVLAIGLVIVGSLAALGGILVNVVAVLDPVSRNAVFLTTGSGPVLMFGAATVVIGGCLLRRPRRFP
ncbi:hypothetical protein [Curtobacterium sp. L1-20]|uniref:hypothetical protein n=1 Tax=Curtobacterium sp. L1-20 TaxID=3138181 RepID=UPI003B523B39